MPVTDADPLAAATRLVEQIFFCLPAFAQAPKMPR
jgi:hypothetical protein